MNRLLLKEGIKQLKNIRDYLKFIDKNKNIENVISDNFNYENEILLKYNHKIPFFDIGDPSACLYAVKVLRPRMASFQFMDAFLKDLAIRGL